MGTVLQQHIHNHAGRTLDAHILAILKRLAKSLARPQGALTVVFVGETHKTHDERRRAALFGNRPSSADLLTVVERGMGMPAAGANLVVESPMETTHFSPFDERRDDSVIAEIGNAFGRHNYRVILVLFGEDHERKFLAKVANNPAIPDMIWHSYPSFNDHTPTTTYPPYDPRSSGYELVGMINTAGMNEIDLAQLAEGVMPRVGPINLCVFTPFHKQASSNWALFVRGALIGQIQNGLRMNSNCWFGVTQDNLPSVKVLNMEGKVRNVPDDFKYAGTRDPLIYEFWQYAV